MPNCARSTIARNQMLGWQTWRRSPTVGAARRPYIHNLDAHSWSRVNFDEITFPADTAINIRTVRSYMAVAWYCRMTRNYRQSTTGCGRRWSMPGSPRLFFGIWVSRRPLMLSRWIFALYALFSLFILWILCVLQVRLELGIADHVWQATRAAIAKTVDSLGDEFCPLFRTGWLAYINRTYGAPQPRPARSVGQEPVVVD